MATRAWVLHLDLDEFMAAVEIARHPELRGRPVVVGGSGDPAQPRTVVATASYEAREYGVHSGLPMRTAARRCPEAVFLPADLPAYEAVSARVMAVLRNFPVVVEVWGIDEAFLGADTDDPEALARAIQRAVADRTGLACSVGIGDNKQQAKIATGFGKPAGVFRLTTATWAAVMGDRPTGALWGIGAKTQRKLAALGLRTVDQLARADPGELAARFGPTNGPWLRYLALGKGESTVTAAPWVPRGHSHETTFTRDLTDRPEMERHLTALAGRLAREAAEEGRRAVRVTVKVRVAPFITRTRQFTLPAATTDPSAIERAALTAFNRFEDVHQVRLLGVAITYEPLRDR